MTAADRAPLRLPERSGAYRWFYADVTAGDLTAVFIFMVGSVFSPRYASSLRKGGLPAQHCAVNFALYERGVRWLWVLSEYDDVESTPTGLRIGSSTLDFGPNGQLRACVKDRTTPWGKPAEATLELTPQGPRGPELALVEGQRHWWQPLAPRASARVTVPQHQLDFTGAGYHDTNHGDEPLGRAFAGWQWTRVHGPARTLVNYQPTGGAPPIRVTADGTTVSAERGAEGETPSMRIQTDGKAVSVEHRAAQTARGQREARPSTSLGLNGTGAGNQTGTGAGNVSVPPTPGSSPVHPERRPQAEVEGPDRSLERTGWGLLVPRQLGAGGVLLPNRPSLLESSPFYARLEARDGETHALSEVADFRRFHSPYVRWMASFRTRVAKAPASRSTP
jgi:carotenoid 1,2-hydratase